MMRRGSGHGEDAEDVEEDGSSSEHNGVEYSVTGEERKSIEETIVRDEIVICTII